MSGSSSGVGSSGGGNRGGSKRMSGGSTATSSSAGSNNQPNNIATTPTRPANSKTLSTSASRSTTVTSSTEKFGTTDMPKALPEFTTPASSLSARSLPNTPHSTSLLHDTTTTPMHPPTTPSNGNSGLEMIKVAVRVRPLLGDEMNEKETMGWGWNESQVYATTSIAKRNLLIASPDTASIVNNNTTQYTFDHVFGPDSTNSQIFDSVVKQIVANSMAGYHGSCFSYGQTSSGKTFTMNGIAGQPGIIAQAVKYCFESVQQYLDREFLIRVSYLEVYNEQIKDLLNHEQPSSAIKIQHDPKQGTVLSGVREQVVANPQQVMTLIKHGELHRHIGVTDMNEKSSRAHTLFKIIIESKDRNSTKVNAPVRVSTLNLVDLAGSESAKMTNSKGDRAREAKYINQSLLTLSLIIQRLSEDHQQHAAGKKAIFQHLPYRDSKLTRLLESALDGNARISIICTISPTVKCMEETNNTLKFGTRAKAIKINAKVNENMDDKALLRVYREEIEQLRLKLRMMEEKQSDQVAHLVTPSTGTTTIATTSPEIGKMSNRPSPKLSTFKKTRSKDDSSVDDNSLHDDDDEEELPSEEQQHMLRMIAEMERLILKGEPALELPPTLTKKKSFASTNPMKSPTSSNVATLTATHSFNLGSINGSNSPTKMQRSLSSSQVNNLLNPTAADVSFSSPPKSSSHKRAGSSKSSIGEALTAELLKQGIGIADSLDGSNDDNEVIKAGSDAWDDIVGAAIIPDNNLGYDDEDANSSKKSASTQEKEIEISIKTNLSNNSNQTDKSGNTSPTLPILPRKKTTTFSDSSKPPLSPSPAQPTNSVVFEGTDEQSSRSVSPMTSLENTRRLLQKAQSVKMDTLFSLYSQLEGNAGRLGIISSPSEDLSTSEIQERVRAMSIEELTSPIVKPNILSSTPVRTKHRILSRSNSLTAMPSPAMLAQHGMMPLDGRVADGISSPSMDPSPQQNRMRRNGSLELGISASRDESAGKVEDIYYNSALSASGPILSTPSEMIMMEEEDDSVMKGVSTMLNLLKDYIAKPNKNINKRHSRGNGSAENLNQDTNASKKSMELNAAMIVSTSDIAISLPTISPVAVPVIVGPTNSVNSTPQPSTLQSHLSNYSISTTPNGSSSVNKADEMVPRAELERLKLEMKLREADNNFLQEELENKDKMLHLLTDGLKEVEEAQKQWLSTNQVLSFELDKALQVNQLLCVEIRRLKGLLEEERIGHNVNVAEETPAQVSGVVSTTVEGANDDTY